MKWDIFSRLLIFAAMLILIILVIYYSEELMTNPIKYVEEHTDRTCVLNTSKYVCACGKYYKQDLPSFDIDKLIELGAIE